MGSGKRTVDDFKIIGACLQKVSNTWSTPFLLADTCNILDCNPVLFINKKGKLFLVCIAVEANKWEYSILRFKTYTDYLKAGVTVWNWLGNILLKPGDNFAAEVAARFKELPDNKAG